MNSIMNIPVCYLQIRVNYYTNNYYNEKLYTLPCRVNFYGRMALIHYADRYDFGKFTNYYTRVVQHIIQHRCIDV